MIIHFIGNTQSKYAFKIPGKEENFGKQRSRLGMVGHDAKKGVGLGARIGGTVGTGQGLISGVRAGNTLKQKIAYGALNTAFGAIGGTATGAIRGGVLGTGVGAGRALLTPRKKRNTGDKLKTAVAKGIYSYQKDK